jgi:hypothetical protein
MVDKSDKFRPLATRRMAASVNEALALIASNDDAR